LWAPEARAKKGKTYSDFEIHKLLSERAHLIIEAESVFARLSRSEDEISLSLFRAIHNDLVPGSHHLVINIEGTSCLDLSIAIHQLSSLDHCYSSCHCNE
jgi:hypothetical protein